MTALTAQAAALQAANSAKHKAEGKTHRVEVDERTARGSYKATHVFYVASSNPTIWAMRKAATLRAGLSDTRVIAL